jgi:putative NIF3 family GTP cyclohydrolase 1 type 2
LRAGKEVIGEGRVGRLPNPTSLGEFAADVRRKLKCGPVQVVGQLDRQVEQVAIACGAAGEYLSDAIRSQAQVFLSGEMRFHDYLHALANKVSLVLPGHYATERFGIEELAAELAQRFAQLKVVPSQGESEPVRWV